MQKIVDLTQKLTDTIKQQPSVLQTVMNGAEVMGKMVNLSSVRLSEPDRPHIGSKMYATFADIYQHQFLSLFSSDEARNEFKTEWENYLSDIPWRKVREACQKLKDPFGEYRNRIPNQMQFKALCLPNEIDLNIPSLEDSFRHALTHSKYTHPFIAVVTKQLDMHTLRQLNQKEAFYQFKTIYEIARKQFLREGKPLPRLATYLQPQGNYFRKITPEEKKQFEQQDELARHQAVNKIYEMLGKPKKYATAIECREHAINQEGISDC